MADASGCYFILNRLNACPKNCSNRTYKCVSTDNQATGTFIDHCMTVKNSFEMCVPINRST